MDLEAAVETQRMALLRLLAGWFVVVGFLAKGPFVLPLPRSVRCFFGTLLTRAELAAQYLLRASVCVQGGRGETCSPQAPMPLPVSCADDALTFEALVGRMTALRELLENLPRVARRMVRRQSRQAERRQPRSHRPARLSRSSALERVAATSTPKTHAPRSERPPDFIKKFLIGSDLPPVSGREAKDVGASPHSAKIPMGRAMPLARHPNRDSPSSFRAGGWAGTSGQYSAASSPLAYTVYG